MPWWSWVNNKIAELPVEVQNMLLIVLACVILAFVFFPKRFKSQAITSVLLP